MVLGASVFFQLAIVTWTCQSPHTLPAVLVLIAIIIAIVLPALNYASEIWVWNGSNQSSINAVENNYLRGVCDLTRWNGESNESVYQRCGMGERVIGIDYGVIERLKHSTLKWFGHVERMGNGEFTKRMLRERVWEVGHWSIGRTELRSPWEREGWEIFIKRSGSVETGRTGELSAVATPFGVLEGSEESEYR